MLVRRTWDLKICCLTKPSTQALRRATVIDELFQSLFENAGKEMGFPMSTGLKSRRENKDTEWACVCMYRHGGNKGSVGYIELQVMLHDVHGAWSLEKIKTHAQINTNTILLICGNIFHIHYYIYMSNSWSFNFQQSGVVCVIYIADHLCHQCSNSLKLAAIATTGYKHIKDPLSHV